MALSFEPALILVQLQMAIQQGSWFLPEEQASEPDLDLLSRLAQDVPKLTYWA